jgi:hypothetical protein
MLSATPASGLIKTDFWRKIHVIYFLERSCRLDSLDFAPASTSLPSQQRLVKLPHKMPLLKSQDFKRDPLSDDDVV